MSLNPAAVAQATSARVSTCRCGCVGRSRRYPSDLTDAQWAVLTPLLPVPACQRPGGGRPERHDRRTMIDAVFYLVDNGVKWRALPGDFPPWRTVYGLFARWCADLSAAQVVDQLRGELRRALGRRGPHWPGASTPSRCTSPPKASCPASPAAMTHTSESTAASVTCWSIPLGL